MLTETQIDQLNNLRTRYPQYDGLITRMIGGWKITTPTFGSYGVKYVNNEIVPKENACTCLIGACFIGLSIDGIFNWYTRAIQQLNISEDDRYEMVSGFDDVNLGIETNAYNFAREVRKIVL